MKYLFLFITLVIFSSCEEVIQVDLDTAAQRIIIDGNIETDLQKATVKISKSGSFYQTNDFEKITNAEVVISNQVGDAFPLTEVSDGFYEMDNFVSVQGDTFSLEIITPDDKLYEAKAVVPEILEIGELTFEERGSEENPFFIVSCFVQDTKDEENFYRVKYYLNGELEKDSYRTFEDRTFDGEYAEIAVFISDAEVGDEVVIELISIDEASYDYFTQIEDIASGGAGTSVPYNPHGNISDEDALGYFGARGSVRDTIILE